MKIMITGAGSGIGLATARELAARGHEVIAGVISQAEADALRDLDRIEPMLLDITNEAHRAQAAAREPDVLVNNAGASEVGPLALIPMERVRSVFEVNVFATLALTQAVIPAMVKRGSGRIVIVSSIAGVRSAPIASPYAMSKHALQAMGASLRGELAPQGIDVALANPGPYGTGFNDRMIMRIDEWLKPPEDEPYRPFIDAMAGRITENQMDPADAGRHMADLCEAGATELVNPIPPGLFEPRRF